MRLTAITLAIISMFPAHLAAQTTDSPPPQADGRWQDPERDGWNVSIGLGAVVAPAWLGADENAVSIFPDLRVNYDDVLFASIPDGVGWNAVREGNWRAGPLVKLGFGRDEDNGGSPFLIAGGSDALIGLGNIDPTAELGGFVETRLGAQKQFQIRAEIRKGLAGGHDGLIVDLQAAFQGRTDSFIYSVGPRATFADDNFMQPFFGITADQSLASGLAPYRPNGGLVSAGLSGTLIRPIGSRSSITVFAGADYLGVEAGRSPLIRERGERFQASIGIGYGYRFKL